MENEKPQSFGGNKNMFRFMNPTDHPNLRECRSKEVNECTMQRSHIFIKEEGEEFHFQFTANLLSDPEDRKRHNTAGVMALTNTEAITTRSLRGGKTHSLLY